MRGLLIYDRAGAERNKWFVGRLIETANCRGCELELVIYEDGIDEALTPLPNFAIVRTIHPKLNKRLEELLIPTYNNYATSRVANDKWQTALLACELGIPVMDTLPITENDQPETFYYPIVIKAVDGHGGNEVFWVDNVQKCKQIMSYLSGKNAIAQVPCDTPGIDTRVYVLGERIVAAVKRTSNSDFRSNFSLGGSAELILPTKDMIMVIDKLRKRLKFDLVGVDFIRHNGEWILNEIEDVVGTRMLYSLTDIDIADEYVKYIIEKTKNKV